MSLPPISAQQQSPISAQQQSGQEPSAQQFQQIVQKLKLGIALQNELQFQQLTQTEQSYGSAFDDS